MPAGLISNIDTFVFDEFAAVACANTEKNTDRERIVPLTSNVADGTVKPIPTFAPTVAVDITIC